MLRPDIKLVVQEDKLGCVGACLAMLLGTTYAEATQLLPKTFKEKGVQTRALLRILRDHGYAALWRPGLQKPWRPIHLVRVAWDQFPNPDDIRHLVVMDSNGVVFDPQGSIHPDLSHFPRVACVWGITPWHRVQS